MNEVSLALGKYFRMSLIALSVALTACGGGGSSSDAGSGAVTASQETVIRGSVGDGPIVGATVKIYDKDGTLIQTEISDTTASYVARVKAKGNTYPLTIEVDDGTDLVTQRGPDFKMSSVVAHPSVNHVNINPFTTLIVESARQMPGGLSRENIELAKSIVLSELNYGLDSQFVADPLETEITANNVGVIVKASETLGEMIRRSRDELSNYDSSFDGDRVVKAIASDIADGVLDGVGGPDASGRVTAVSRLASAQVLIEALSNNLKVDGQPATQAMDNAIRATSGGMMTGDVLVAQGALQQAKDGVAVARRLTPSIELTTIADALNRVRVGSTPREVEAILPADTSSDLVQVIALVPSMSDAELAGLTDNTGTDSGNTADTPVVNSAPIISNSPATVVLEDASYKFVPAATDAEGDRLTFSIKNRPVWASFSSSTGQLSGVPNNSHVGDYNDITITVSDGVATDSVGPFNITVANTNDAPSISGTPKTSVSVGSVYNFQPSASDPDTGDSLVFSIANRPSWAAFNTSTGQLSGTPGSGAAGSYSNIVISVSDGTESRSLAGFSITVNTVAAANSAPVITGSPATSVAEDTAYVFVPGASDADNDKLTFAIANRPSWASFDTNTGRLAGTPGNAHVGTYSNVAISVSDGSATSALGPFSITVVNTNDVPTISGTPAASVEEGTPYSFRPSATDPDGDKLVFSITNRPAWASFDSNTGALTGTPGAAHVGTYSNVVVSVSDGSATAALPAFTVTVNAAAVTTGSMVLNWSAPTERSDGTALALTDIAGYTIYYGKTAGTYTSSFDIDNNFTTSTSVTDLPVGTYYVVVTTRDIDGRESEYSNMVTKVVN